MGQKWRPVEKWLPEDQEQVLAYLEPIGLLLETDKEICRRITAAFDRKLFEEGPARWYDFQSDEDINVLTHRVTHWMPLSSPPKEPAED
tara:strand:- start:34 stop:300 length:267 start_codon:yes stop_codon:yes gene_type:complete